jgi:hypothetical protein
VRGRDLGRCDSIEIGLALVETCRAVSTGRFGDHRQADGVSMGVSVGTWVFGVGVWRSGNEATVSNTGAVLVLVSPCHPM